METKINNRTNKTSSLRKITVTAIMSALSLVLMMIEFQIPIMPSFIKFDVSELPALITSFAFGPVWGVLVCLIKNLLHLINTHTAGVGELSNFLLGAFFVAVAGVFYKIKHNRTFAFLGSLAGDFVMAAAAFFINVFLVYPLYIKLLNFPEVAIMGAYNTILKDILHTGLQLDALWKAILLFNVPFTFIKGMVDVLITFVIYRRISPILKGKS